MSTFNLKDFEIGKGAFSDVLIDKARCKAFKLFKNYNHPDLRGTGEEQIGETTSNEFRKKVFQNELQAYTLIQASQELIRFTPKFLGHVIIDEVLFGEINVSANYLIDCCFGLEFIDGDSLKFNMIDEERIAEFESKFEFKKNSLVGEFSKNGVNYLKDASVIINPKQFKIIDFGIEDPYKFEPYIQ